MGSVQTKGVKRFQSSSSSSLNDGDEKVVKVVEGLKQKVRVLQNEVNEIMWMRENESQLYEQEMIVFAFKEAEWRKERKKLRDEVKKLKKLKLDQKQEMKKKKVDQFVEEELEEDDKNNNNGEVVMCDQYNDKIDEENCCHKDCQDLGNNSHLLNKIREEQARRDEAIEKWKQLYFVIKDELDYLILRTNQGERLCRKAEEEEEIRAKEESIKQLKAKVATLEQQELKRERELDILRQSLKIMFHNNKSHYV